MAELSEIERLKIVSDVLHDSAYLAGMKAGWNAAQAKDPDAAYASLHASRKGYLKPLRALQSRGQG